MNYGERRAALIEYLKSKTQEADWHAVSDAANDLRVMEAKGSAETEPLSAAEASKGSPTYAERREYMLRAAVFRVLDNRCGHTTLGKQCALHDGHLGYCRFPP